MLRFISWLFVMCEKYDFPIDVCYTTNYQPYWDISVKKYTKFGEWLSGQAPILKLLIYPVVVALATIPLVILWVTTAIVWLFLSEKYLKKVKEYPILVEYYQEQKDYEEMRKRGEND